MTTLTCVYSPDWPRPRRLAITGTNNPNYRTGRYTRFRRARLEAPLGVYLRQLRPGRLVAGVTRLPHAAQHQVGELLGWLTGPWHPQRWAMQDPRPGKGGGWYVPRAAWAIAAAWLRRARQALRLLQFHPSTILRPMRPLLRRGFGGSLPISRDSSPDEPRSIEARRQRGREVYEVFRRQHGLG